MDLEGGVQGGNEGWGKSAFLRRARRRGGDSAGWQGGHGHGGNGDTNSGAGLASAALGASAASTGTVPKTRMKGEAPGTSGEGSQTNSAVSDTGSEIGVVTELQPATVGRRRGRMVVTSNPEVGTQSRLNHCTGRGTGGGGLRALVGGMGYCIGGGGERVRDRS